jgi:membrane-bound metal-dependent hydrolase YbcI (DUF457 family)
MHPYRGWPFLTSPQHPTLSAVGAFFIHGAISLFVVFPIVWRSDKRLLFGALAFLGGPAVDLDHAVAAGSFRPRALETLSHRPDTHSLLFALVLTLLAYILTRSKQLSWSILAIIVSHLLFDAAGGDEYWLYPLKHPNSIPWLACPLGIALLFWVSTRLASDVSPDRGGRGQPLTAQT